MNAHWDERTAAIAALIQNWLEDFREMPADATADDIERAVDRTRTDFIAVIAKEVCQFEIIPEIDRT